MVFTCFTKNPCFTMVPLNSEILNCSSSLELIFFLLLSACKIGKRWFHFSVESKHTFKYKVLHFISFDLLLAYISSVNSTL